MNVRNTRLTLSISLTFALGVLAAGCSSGSDGDKKSSSTSGGSTTAPTTSGTNPGGGTNPPPAPTLQTETLVSSFNLNEVIEVDAQTGAINNRWATGNGPTDIANDILFSYVANAGDQNVAVLDRLANNTVGNVDVTQSPLTGLSLLNFVDPYLKPLARPTGVAVSPDGRKVVSANLLNASVIDATTMTVRKSFLGLNQLSINSLINNPSQALNTFFAAPVRGLGMAKVAATNDVGLVTCMISGTVMRIDLNTNTLLGYTDVGDAPIGITVAGGKAYVACAIANEINVIDVATGALLRTIPAGMIPVDVAKNQAESRIYVANALGGDISVIDTASDMVIDTLPAGMSITSIFSQMGVTLPTGTGAGGINAAINGFLQGFTGGVNNPTSFGSLVFNNGGSLLSPANLINGLITGFLAYAGVNQQQLAGVHLPGIGIMSIGVAHDPSMVCAGNAFMGELVVTHEPTRAVNQVQALTGLGPVDVAPLWRR
jgi:YVTN family beta-propeller protein